MFNFEFTPPLSTFDPLSPSEAPFPVCRQYHHRAVTLARPFAGCGRMGDAAPALPASGTQQNDSTPPQQPRKQSAFDVLLKSKRQSKPPRRTSLEAVQAAVKRSGGAFSPAASPSSKRIRTPTGVNSLRVCMWHLGVGMQQTVLSRAAVPRTSNLCYGLAQQESSYAACPLCGANMARALLTAHTNSCMDDGGGGRGSAATGNADASGQEPAAEQQATAPAAAAPAELSRDLPRAQAAACPSASQVTPSASTAGNRQARLGSGGILQLRPARRSTENGSQRQPHDRRPAVHPAVPQSERPAQDAAAADASHTGSGAASHASREDNSSAAPPARPGSNAFAAMMQKQRELSQVGQTTSCCSVPPPAPPST